MQTNRVWSLLAMALLAILITDNISTEACMCFPSHPQTQFCQADYAIIVRVLRKAHRLIGDKVAYKIQVKKSYKMNDAGHKMLKHGRILTAKSESTCGVSLEIGKLYMIAGRAPDLNTCDYIKEYTKMSKIERRGFSGVYRKGCKCKVEPCFSNQCLTQRETVTGCKWQPFSKCETEFSACMPASWKTPEGVIAKCHWRRTPAYKACMSDP